MKCVLCNGEVDEIGACVHSDLHWKITTTENLSKAIEKLQRDVYYLLKTDVDLYGPKYVSMEEKTNSSSPQDSPGLQTDIFNDLLLKQKS